MRERGNRSSKRWFGRRVDEGMIGEMVLEMYALKFRRGQCLEFEASHRVKSVVLTINAKGTPLLTTC